jgi:hypothetical protein
MTLTTSTVVLHPTCYHIDGEVLAKEALGLTPLNQSPHSLRAQQVDLETAEAELEC